MTDEQFKAILICGALLAGVSGGGGFTAGRVTAPVPPAPVAQIQHHIVEIPIPVYMPMPPAKIEDRIKVDAEPLPQPKPGEAAPMVKPKAGENELRPQAAPPAVVSKPQAPLPKAATKSYKKSYVKKPRATGRAQRKPTADECKQMSSSVALLGRAGVKSGGRLRGYSEAQVERALRDCGL